MKKMSKKKKYKLFIPIIFILLFVVTLIIVLLLSKNKTMICTKTENVSELIIETEIEMSFKYSKIQDVNLLMEIDLEKFSEYKDILLEELSAYEKDVSINSLGDIVYISIKGDSTILNIFEKEKYDKVKKQLKEQGYTCK